VYKVALQLKLQTKQKMDILLVLLLFTTAFAQNEANLFGLNQDNPAASCHEIYQHNPTSREVLDNTG